MGKSFGVFSEAFMPVILYFADTAGFTILLNEHIPDYLKKKVNPRVLCIGQNCMWAARYNSTEHFIATEWNVQTLAESSLCHVPYQHSVQNPQTKQKQKPRRKSECVDICAWQPVRVCPGWAMFGSTHLPSSWVRMFVWMCRCTSVHAVWECGLLRVMGNLGKELT